MKQVFRGSREGWIAKNDFHRLCDAKGPTLKLIKVKETGRICGGYTSVSWASKYAFLPENDAYVWSVDSQTVYHTY